MSSIQQQQQTRDDESPAIAAMIAANRGANTTTPAVIRAHTAAAAFASNGKPFKKKFAPQREEHQQERHLMVKTTRLSSDSNELRDSPLTFMTSSSSSQESLIEAVRDGTTTPTSFPSTISIAFPLCSLVEDPSWKNLDYIQVDDTFDEFVQVKEASTSCNIGGFSRRNPSSTTNNNCVSLLDSIYCNNGSAGNNINCLMTVDESPSVEPLSCQDKILQPALGCDEIAVESCIHYTWNCTDKSSNQSSNKSAEVTLGADTTKRVVDNASEERELRCRQKMHDEEEVDDDEEDEIDITTFIDMIKMIFTTRWSDIYNELLLQ